MVIRSPLPGHPFRAVRQRHQRLLEARAVRDSLFSLAGLLRGRVYNQAGAEIGSIVDVVARWDGEEPYPPVTGLVVLVVVGQVTAVVEATAVTSVPNDWTRFNWVGG